MFGYIDESGAPGSSRYSRDCLLVSVVLFESEESRDEAIRKIDKLAEELKLPENYEFHCKTNSTKPQSEFLKLIPSLDFRFITIAIHKNDFKKTASYNRLSSLIMDEVEKRYSTIKLEMDSNPLLYAEMRKQIKERKLRYVKIRQRNSRSNRLIQLADYVVNISGKKAKNTPKAAEWYRTISKKVLTFIEIAD